MAAVDETSAPQPAQDATRSGGKPLRILQPQGPVRRHAEERTGARQALVAFAPWLCSEATSSSGRAGSTRFTGSG